jgi:hypothetical protein
MDDVESVDDMARRIKPGTMKRTMFEVLVDNSGAAGLSVGDIYAELERRGQVAGWADEKAARSAISSACSADPGMARLRQGVFALKARVPRDALARLAGGGGGSGDGSGGGGGSARLAAAAAAAAAAAPAGPITVQRTSAARRGGGGGGPRPGGAVRTGSDAAAGVQSAAAVPGGAVNPMLLQQLVAHQAALARAGGGGQQPPPQQNDHVCVACRAAYHSTFSPLVLCDRCPRAFHLVCLNLDWGGIPESGWTCPVCVAAAAPAPAQLAGGDTAAAVAQQQLLERERQRVREREVAGWSGILFCCRGGLLVCCYTVLPERRHLC